MTAPQGAIPFMGGGVIPVMFPVQFQPVTWPGAWMVQDNGSGSRCSGMVDSTTCEKVWQDCISTDDEPDVDGGLLSEGSLGDFSCIDDGLSPLSDDDIAKVSPRDEVSKSLSESGLPDGLMVHNTFIAVDTKPPSLRKVVTSPGSLFAQDISCAEPHAKKKGTECKESEISYCTESKIMVSRTPMSMRAKYGV